VIHYCACCRRSGSDWKVFALVRGAAQHLRLHEPAGDRHGAAHGPATWQPGEVIEDIQDITLRPDWKSPTATLLVGLIEAGEHGIGDRMIAAGDRVQDRRESLARVLRGRPVEGAAAAGDDLYPARDTPIAIDGVASDPAWLTAVTSPEFATGEAAPNRSARRPRR